MIDFTRVAFLIAGLICAFLAQSRAGEIDANGAGHAVFAPAHDGHELIR